MALQQFHFRKVTCSLAAENTVRLFHPASAEQRNIHSEEKVYHGVCVSENAAHPSRSWPLHGFYQKEDSDTNAFLLFSLMVSVSFVNFDMFSRQPLTMVCFGVVECAIDKLRPVEVPLANVT